MSFKTRHVLTDHSAGIATTFLFLLAGLCGSLIVAYAIAGTRISTAPDQAGLWYKAGPLTSNKFDHCVNPSTRQLFGGIADDTFTYPAGQRTYEFAKGKVADDDGNGVDAAPITVLTKDNIELSVEGVARFTLNTDCLSLRKFHESVGIKFAAHMDGDRTSAGWRSMLRVYLRNSLQRAMNEATQEVSWKDLYNSTAEKKKWETRVNELLPRFVEQSMGGEYFENYSLTIQKPTLPEPLLNALTATQVAIQENAAQEKRNTTVKTELESIRELVKVLGPDAYNVYKAIQDGKIEVMPIPTGSGVVISPSAKVGN